jgi:hypothetical protein
MTAMASASHGEREDDIGGAVAEIADAAADEDLVDDVVERAGEQRDDAGQTHSAASARPPAASGESGAFPMMLPPEK